MKRFTQVTFAIKINACFCFTGFMVFCVLLELLCKVSLLSVGWVIQTLVLSFICGALQYIFYSGEVVKRMSTAKRAVCFALLLLAAVLTFAVTFHWFPVDEWTAWAVFFGTFLLGFLGIGAGFEIMFRVTGKRYTNLLDLAQKQK